jgi:hypothetical protein
MILSCELYHFRSGASGIRVMLSLPAQVDVAKDRN